MKILDDSLVEKRFLGLVLHDPKTFFAAVDRWKLTLNNFLEPSHKTVFDAAMRLRDEGLEPDVNILTDKLVESAPGNLCVTLLELSDHGCVSQQVDFYAHLVRERAAERQIVDAAPLIAKQANAEDFDAVQKTAEAIAAAVSDKKQLPTGDSVRSLLERHWPKVEAAYERRTAHHTPLGDFKRLDAMIGGLLPGELLVFAGPTSSGKSSFFRSAAVSIAKLGHTVGIVSVEDPEETWSNRLLGSESELNTRKIRIGDLGTDDWRKLYRAMDVLRPLPLHIECLPSGSTSNDCVASMRRLAASGAKLIIVDYAQAIHDHDKRGRHVELSAATAKLKGEASRLGVSLIIGSQFSREAIKGSNGKPPIWGIKESGDIENIAEAVAALWCQEGHDVGHLSTCMSLHVLKAKNGTRGVIPLVWASEYTRYSEARTHEW